MDHRTIHAFVAEYAALLKTAGPNLDALRNIVHTNYLPTAGAFTGAVGGAALGGGEAYLHNRGAAPENKKSVLGRTLAGAGIGAGIGAGAGHLSSVGLDKGKTYLTNALHDIAEGATTGVTQPIARDLPNMVGESIRRGAEEIGASPATAGRGFFKRLVGRG